jgi:hypothetical protein
LNSRIIICDINKEIGDQEPLEFGIAATSSMNDFIGMKAFWYQIINSTYNNYLGFVPVSGSECKCWFVGNNLSSWSKINYYITSGLGG